MDIKTLSTIIGHVSTSTTLNVYAHITDEMQKTAAAKIDRGIAKLETAQDIDTVPRKPMPSTFQARKGQRRKQEPAVSVKSMKTSGKDDIPPDFQTALASLETSTHTVRKNAKKNWQR